MSESDFPHLEGFKFEDYAKRSLEQQEGSLEEEIQGASELQEERETSTPDEDWEKRYRDLEQHNSRQAQELGSLRRENAEYKDTFDQYLLNNDPTPTEETEPVTISSEDWYERPDEAVDKKIDNHPAIREARAYVENARQAAIQSAQREFEGKHPNYQETMSDPAFKEWVFADATRVNLAQQADQWNFGAADALFSLYEAETQLNGITATQRADQALQNAELESAGIGEPPPDTKYSRREMREIMIRARQGDQEAERYLEVELPKYRAALQAGQVAD